MKEKNKNVKLSIVWWSVGIMIFIGGYLLEANPVSALNELAFQSPVVTPTDEPTVAPTGEPTVVPTDEPTPTPTPAPIPGSANLAIEGPDSTVAGETVQLSAEARGVADNGLYGVQLEINFDPAQLSVSDVQVNPDFVYVLQSSADNTSGKISLVASRQGRVAGLTGDVPLLTFKATAIGGAGVTTLSFQNAKLGDPQADPLTFTSEDFDLLVEDNGTPDPTTTPTSEPTDPATPEPTDTPTPEPTDPATPEPTTTPTSEPTDPATPEPTTTPTSEPTDPATPEPTTTPTPLPGSAVVSGQVVLAGRANNNWLDGVVTVDDTQQSATTDADGRFSIINVAVGSYSSITADAPGYLPAVCTTVTITAPETALAPVSLLSGDINDDEVADIADATAIGVSFGQTGPDLPADINRDDIIDIFDVILVSVNFGQETQTWSCQAN